MPIGKSALFDEMRNAFKNLDIRYRRNRKIELAKLRIPRNPRTEKQQAVRQAYGKCVEMWRSLSPEEKEEWNQKAEPYAISGWNLFVKETLPSLLAPEVWYEVTITEQSGNNLTDYQILISIDGDSEFFASAENKREAIRVYDSDKTTKLPYWIEEWNPSTYKAKIWTKVPSIPANGTKTIYLYIDPSLTASEENPKDVFIFYDDLEAGIDNFTHYRNGVISWVDGELDMDALSATNDNVAAINVGTFSLPLAVDFEEREIAYYDNEKNWMSIHICKSYPGDWTDNSGHTFLLRHNRNFQFFVDGSLKIGDTPSGVTPTEKLKVTMRAIDGRIWVDINGVNKVDWSGTIANKSGYISFNNYGFHHRVDNVRIRKYIYPEPSISYTKL